MVLWGDGFGFIDLIFTIIILSIPFLVNGPLTTGKNLTRVKGKEKECKFFGGKFPELGSCDRENDGYDAMQYSYAIGS